MACAEKRRAPATRSRKAWDAYTRTLGALLADAERRKNLAEQVVARELAGQLAQRRLRVAQVLGGELERTIEVCARGAQLRARSLERVEVAATRAASRPA